MIAHVSPPRGIDRLLTLYARRRWRGFIRLSRLFRPHGLSVRSRYGVVLDLTYHDYIDEVVLQEGFYESEVFEALLPFFVPGAVFWDVGANLGLHALSCALQRPQVEVHAFEPNPALFARLAAHTERNQVKVACHEMALGEQEGPAPLFIHSGGNSGMTTLVAGSGRFDRVTPVRVARADQLIATGEVPPPTVMKVDVEGSEAAVLRGFGTRLQDPGLRAVVFESDANLLNAPECCPAATQLLNAGFRLQSLQRSEATAHLLGNFLATRNA
jgi:FkbM family methyltransferase